LTGAVTDTVDDASDDSLNDFGPGVAEEYDEFVRGDEDDAADFLAELAADRPALELAIGNGRIALPLLERGVRVAGVDSSQPMLDLIGRHPRGHEIPVVLGDMTTDAPEGSYGLVFLVYNTIGNVLTQEGQVAVFRNAASRLTDDGVFVIENLTPWGTAPTPQSVEVADIHADGVVIDAKRYDRATQRLWESRLRITSDGIRSEPMELRLVAPAELDLMAQLAGLRLHDRYGGWHREPFTADSTHHVSVYGR
jgi:SAM-dependent methyltransferase